MLLNEEQTRELVNQIIERAKLFLQEKGTLHRDPETGLVHAQYTFGGFILIEHQRQKIKTGTIKTNGLDLWTVEDNAAKKLLSVNYVPFQIKYFQKSGKAEWIERFLEGLPAPKPAPKLNLSLPEAGEENR